MTRFQIYWDFRQDSEDVLFFCLLYHGDSKIRKELLSLGRKLCTLITESPAYAPVAQRIERDVADVEAAGPNPARRTIKIRDAKVKS